MYMELCVYTYRGETGTAGKGIKTKYIVVNYGVSVGDEF